MDWVSYAVRPTNTSTPMTEIAKCSADEARKKYGIKVLAYGHPKDNENKVYQVLEVDDMNQMQEAMKDPEIAKARIRANHPC